MRSREIERFSVEGRRRRLLKSLKARENEHRLLLTTRPLLVRRRQAVTEEMRRIRARLRDLDSQGDGNWLDRGGD